MFKVGNVHLNAEFGRVGRSSTAAVVLIPAVLVLAFAAVAGLSAGETMDHLVRDVAAIAGINPFYGALSQLGLALWGVTIGITLLSAVLLSAGGRGREAAFMLSAGALTALVLLDDMLQIHEVVGPFVGIPDKLVLGALAVAALAYLVVWRREVLATKLGFLLLTVAFFGVSVAIDVVEESSKVAIGHWHFLVEDGFKWLGIASWLGYQFSVAVDLVLRPTTGDKAGSPQASL